MTSLLECHEWRNCLIEFANIAQITSSSRSSWETSNKPSLDGRRFISGLDDPFFSLLLPSLFLSLFEVYWQTSWLRMKRDQNLNQWFLVSTLNFTGSLSFSMWKGNHRSVTFFCSTQLLSRSSHTFTLLGTFNFLPEKKRIQSPSYELWWQKLPAEGKDYYWQNDWLTVESIISVGSEDKLHFLFFSRSLTEKTPRMPFNRRFKRRFKMQLWNRNQKLFDTFRKSCFLFTKCYLLQHLPLFSSPGILNNWETLSSLLGRRLQASVYESLFFSQEELCVVHSSFAVTLITHLDAQW